MADGNAELVERITKLHATDSDIVACRLYIDRALVQSRIDVARRITTLRDAVAHSRHGASPARA